MWFFILNTILMFLLIFVIIPATINRDFGIRTVYISLLVKMFKWGTEKIETEEKKGLLCTPNEIIEKQNSIHRVSSLGELKEVHKDFELEDMCYLAKSGIEAVIDDEVTKRFAAEELPSWNLLSRSNIKYQFISRRLTVMWVFGFLVRYLILFPLRVLVTSFTLSSLAICASLVATLPNTSFKRWIVYQMNVIAFRMMCRGISAIITYHDRENLPKSGGICVANHTTVIDAVVLMQDRPYAILGQKHSGFLGWCMDTISKSAKHVWFERSEASDRKFVAKRMMEHISDDRNYPILLFPEGTCINNTSVMMFKKGSFELPTTVYPVAIKYNPWFGDAFWNSSKQNMLQYLLKVMTSWALVADVWYLPAMNKRLDEDAIQFANRVKNAIARKGGLVDSVWDGQLKRMRVKQQQKLDKQREIGKIFGFFRVDTDDEDEGEAAEMMKQMPPAAVPEAQHVEKEVAAAVEEVKKEVLNSDETAVQQDDSVEELVAVTQRELEDVAVKEVQEVEQVVDAPVEKVVAVPDEVLVVALDEQQQVVEEGVHEEVEETSDEDLVIVKNSEELNKDIKKAEAKRVQFTISSANDAEDEGDEEEEEETASTTTAQTLTDNSVVSDEERDRR